MAKMLIADDNKQITSILSNYARKEGFEPVVALDGEEALRLFDEHEPDIARYCHGAFRCYDAESGRF